MTIAYWCVLVAAYLPILWVGSAKFSDGKFGKVENSAPRQFLANLTGWQQRANWAQANAFEAFPPFAAAVIIGHLCNITQSTLDLLAIAFILLRVLHGLFYILNFSTLRSLVWIAATGCVITIFVMSV